MAGLIHHQDMIRCPKLYFFCTYHLTGGSKTKNRPIFKSKYKGLLFSTVWQRRNWTVYIQLLQSSRLKSAFCKAATLPRTGALTSAFYKAAYLPRTGTLTSCVPSQLLQGRYIVISRAFQLLSARSHVRNSGACLVLPVHGKGLRTTWELKWKLCCNFS